MNPDQILDALIQSVEELLQSGQQIDPALLEEITQEIGSLTEQINSARNSTLPSPGNEPPSDNVQLVWILSGGREDVFRDYLSNFPDPEFSQILANPSRFDYLVRFLSENNPISNAGQAADGIPKSEINSSNVYGVKYDFDRDRLLVRFNSGAVYSYDVPPAFYNLVSGGQASATTNDKRKPMRYWEGKNPSLGAAVWQYLRNTGVPYKRLK